MNPFPNVSRLQQNENQANQWLSSFLPSFRAQSERLNSHVFFRDSNFGSEKSQKYTLQKYQRSNQDTLIFQRPFIRDGEWVQYGDIVADCSTSFGGELCLGKNIFVAYMPWEGYNYEDALLISERLVSEDLYTSLHIESYEVETRHTKYGKEEFTKQIPDLPESETKNLDERGIIKVGTSVKEGDILVGKVTPIQKKFASPYEKLLYTILEKELLSVRESSLRTPKGLKAKVLEVKIVSFSDEPMNLSSRKTTSSVSFGAKSSEQEKMFFSSNATKNNKFLFGKKIVQNPFLSFSAPRNNFSNFSLSTFFSFSNSFQFQKTFFSAISVQNPKILLEFFQKKHQTNKKEYWFKKQKRQTEKSFFWKQDFEKLSNEKVLKKSFFFQKTMKSLSFSPISSFRSLLLLQKTGLQQQNFPQHFGNVKIQNQNFVSNRRSFRKNLNWEANQENQPWLRFQPVQSQGRAGKSHSFFPPSLSEEKGEMTSREKIAQKIQVYLVEKRKIQVGDKMSGRHGNKGIVSQILPIPDMPFLPDGTPLDMVLNPLGVPSRMNVGQIYECILGLASKYLQEYYRIQPFDEIYGPQASRTFTFSKLYEARRKTSQKWLLNPCFPGKMYIFDGQTGEPYENPVTVGVSYILKLVHLVDDKIHARSTGPYSLVTQQPLRGRSKYGGQRLGEMEVWAIEAYGAAFVLLEMLTIKSDDISGRMTLWSNILSNMPIYIGTPESFKVLVCELQALCLDIGLYRFNKKGFLTQIEHLMQLP
jgi:DNA-directed RNA polymerase subunit beta